jgi:hypothetical protein
MLERLKTLTQTETRAGADEFVYSLTEETRAAIKLDVRYALRDAGPNRAREFPLLTLLGQTMDRNLNRIRFPAEVLAKLAREIGAVRSKLPEQSPLAEFADSARKDLGAISPIAGMAVPPVAAPAPAPAPAAVPTAREEVQSLKSAAAQVEVTYMTTMELGDQALAGYLKYCLGVGEYDKIIEALRPRANKAPRVWVWSLLTTAMRLAEHPDFEATAREFHAWLQEVHPETLIHGKDERRRFSVEKIAALEEEELARR